MKKLHAIPLALAALLVLLGGVPPARAQEPQAPPSVFGEQIEVRVVNVEVVVTDRQGNRVADLKPGDFRLKVDGKTVPIEYFNEVRGGQAIALAEGGDGSRGESSVKGLPSLAPGTPVGTSYLVFVDNFFSVGPRRNEVLRSLKDQLSRLGPEDRMAIVAYDGGGVRMLTSWTSSQRQLGQAVEQAIGDRAQGVTRLAELRSFESSRRLPGVSFEPTPRQSFAQRLDIEELEYADRLAAQTERAVAAAASTLRGFASPPGRKVMLLLSGGWPFSPVDFVVNNPNRPVLDRDVPRGEEIFRPLVDTANRLGYTVYPVDVPGVESGTVDAGLASPAPAGLNIREQEHQASLAFVADQTGGKALLNAQSTNVLPAVESDTRSYYWLGFTPSWQGNDKRHRVAVEVARPGLKVRAREDFLDLSRKAETSMMVESAMLFGSAPDAAPLAVQIGRPVAVGRKEMEVPVALAIPVDAVTFIPLEGKYVAEVELRVAAMDTAGNRAPVPVIPVTLRSDTEPKAGTAVKYETRIKLRRLPHDLTLAIFDPQSGKILTTRVEVLPPPK
ncbi:MAG TPA: VWA domain-containing protein [Thermoanaerobaculia bacterium]|jgi:VWFA-related protein|nr:VWA domain-containing protein [Thermoanaerobaculia bacterium]